MFFPKLRRNAKWVFLFLAIVFALGFVGFGVGAGGVGIGDVFRGTAGASGVPSISESEKRITENPRDAAAFRDLATAYQAAGNTNEAIEALENFVVLKPKNAAALVDLASLYLVKVDEAQQRANVANIRAAYLAPGAAVVGFTQFGGSPLEPDAISGRGRPPAFPDRPDGARTGPNRGGAGRRRVQAARRNRASECALPARARPDGGIGRRPGLGDYRIREVPRAGAGRPERARRQGAAEAASSSDRRDGLVGCAP